MPIYEFYCHKCNTVYSFFSKSVNTDKTPNCPKCKRIKLKRQMSVFYRIGSGGDEPPEGADMPEFDEAAMNKALDKMAGEADRLDGADPRQAADFMRKLAKEAGMNLGPAMEEALRRMEKGVDPEQIDEEMGDILDAEAPLLLGGPKGRKGAAKPPRPQVDETLYDL
ncbi:MAG: zinc ribbon domain-containing protein [Pseudomonadota bacterium]|nr:zinc ribbon domain-containing protein [Pseudomonadota bacterium]